MNEQATNERCTRCGALLMGSERLSETCNRCFGLGYESMADEEYDALDIDEHERLNNLASLRLGRSVTTKRNGGIMGGLEKMAKQAGLVTALALSLAAPASAQAMPPLPAQCFDTGRDTEFGGPYLRCADGTVWYQDMDGAGGYNSGIPYRPPGTWVQITEAK